MKLGLELFGMRKNLLHQVSIENAKRQIFIFNLLAVMLIVLSIFGAAAGLIYALVIFNNWIIAISCAVFIGLIFFLLLQLIHFLSLQTLYKEIKNQLSNMESIYEQYKHQDLSAISDEEVLEIVTQYRMSMRKNNLIVEPAGFNFSQLFISSLFISILLICSILVSSALQIWMYRHTLNNTFEEIKNKQEILELAQTYKNQDHPSFLEQKMEADWTLRMLNPAKGQEFKFINCQSILMTFDILFTGLGKTKIIIDLLFSFMFLIPYLIIKRSKEISGGELLKEASIEAVSTSFLMFLLATRQTNKIEQKIQTSFDYNQALGIK